MSIKELKWRGCTIVGVILLVILASILTPAVAQEPVVEKNPYLVRTFIDEEGRQIDEVIFPGRPPEIKAAAATVPEPNIEMGINVLPDVPAFDWCYGCSATSAAMMFGYYDRTGYPNMYAGPTNGGICPLTNSVWGSGECPLSATHRSYDGLAERGHFDDYWYSYGSSNDPYYGHWTEHGYADCTADFMGTNQYVKWKNTDGSTTFYFYTDGTPLYDYSTCEGGSPPRRDGCHGMRLFVESRNYKVYHDGSHYLNYNQYVDTYKSGGFTFNQYKAEIDVGRPVIIQVDGHSMLGYGYSDPNTVYLHDTWDHLSHEMTWGGSYSGLQHYGVTVLQLKVLPEISSCNATGTNKTFFQPGGSVYVQGSKFDPSTSYKIWIQDSPVSEGDTLVTGEDDSGSQENATTNSSGTLNKTLAWAIPGGPFVHHDYDIIVDRQNDGSNTGKYNVASDGKVSFHVGMGGDVNCDAYVDFGDVLAIRNNWFYSFPVGNDWAADVNCDGYVDFGDVLAVRNHWFYGFALNCCTG
jgi:hypothetical protein